VGGGVGVVGGGFWGEGGVGFLGWWGVWWGGGWGGGWGGCGWGEKLRTCPDFAIPGRAMRHSAFE